MSKAKEYAEKFILTVDHQGDVEEAYNDGYEQAEKDLELSWEDISEIFRISEQLKISWWFIDNEQTKKIGTQVFWEEILKRFKKGKDYELYVSIS